MAHPNKTRKIGKSLWHLEDEFLTKQEAEALQKHLINTEEKRAFIENTENNGWQVWWSK